MPREAELKLDIGAGRSLPDPSLPRIGSAMTANADNGAESLYVASVCPLEDDTLPDFVREPDDRYRCVQCGNIHLPPVNQMPCGHRVCERCVPAVLDGNTTVSCPGDDGDCEPVTAENIKPDRAITKELLRMKVYCPNKRNGCTAEVKWSALNEHRKTCSYVTEQCHNPGCSATVLRSELQSHEEECEYLPLLCPTCDQYVPRREMENGHKSACVPKPRKCAYGELGCTFQGMPHELKQHAIEYNEIHAQQVATLISTLNGENTSLKEQLSQLISQFSNIQELVDTLQLDSNNTKVQSLQKSLARLSEDVIKTRRELEEKADKSVLDSHASKLDDIQTVAKMHESRITYLEQGIGGASNDQALQKIRQIEGSIGAYDVRFAEHDVRFRLLETAGYDGKLVWKISDYARRKKDAIDGRTISLYSQPFYSSVYGYRMCARVYLNGDGMGRGTHMSLFFVVMRSDYDALLKWPFRPRVTLALLDQSGSRRHLKDTFRPDPTSTSFRRPANEMNIASGSPLFAEHSKVESDSYLRDDTIFISVTVDQSELEEIA